MNMSLTNYPEDPYTYFFNMFASYYSARRLTYGDFFRIFKYFRIFDNWDMQDQIRNYVIYPEKLTADVNLT